MKIRTLFLTFVYSSIHFPHNRCGAVLLIFGFFIPTIVTIYEFLEYRSESFDYYTFLNVLSIEIYFYINCGVKEHST